MPTTLIRRRGALRGRRFGVCPSFICHHHRGGAQAFPADGKIVCMVVEVLRQFAAKSHQAEVIYTPTKLVLNLYAALIR